jgi:hypothetical protein
MTRTQHVLMMCTIRCDKSFELHDDVTVLEFMQMAQVENEQELRQVSLHPFFLSLSRFDSSKIPNPLPPPFPSLSEPALRAAGQSGGIPRRAMRRGNELCRPSKEACLCRRCRRCVFQLVCAHVCLSLSLWVCVRASVLAGCGSFTPPRTLPRARSVPCLLLVV